jgi:ferredoxin
MLAISGAVSGPRRWLMTLMVVGIIGVLTLLQASPALACEISINPSSGEPSVDDQQQVVVTVIQTHRTCITPIEETIIQAQNLDIVSEGAWREIEGGHEKELTVTFTQPVEATLTVVRECSKGGDTAVATFDVQPVALPTTPTAQPSPSLNPTTPPESVASPSPATVKSEKTGTPSGRTSDIGSQIVRTFEDPKTIGTVVLLAMATFAYLRGYQRLRRVIMLVSVGYLGFYIGGCLCPLGAVQNLVLSGTTLKVAFLVTLAIPLLATLLFGRLYCGWVCPAGGLQEIVHSEKNAITVPPPLHRWLKYLKYVALVSLIALVALAGERVFENWDPFKVAWNLGGAVVPLAVLAAIIVTSAFVYRPWCRYLCPMGAIFGLAARLSLLRLVPEASCVGCKLCSRNCHTQSLAVDKETKRVTIDQGECMSCGACRSTCRKEGIRLGVPSLIQSLIAWRPGADKAPASPETIRRPAREAERG